ncbi:MAG: tRNA preQ1(34) S-adenosylmethionine ribosyltransferase-isomerase QueA [Candidatus Sumerlaeaceae bacterium]|nr:tRNA preQ1(34) S-adenosylmethionine ribosyltransferase-isomerase QueA [Candidatus Sumerlaeaceae bacterium]
MRTDLFDYHLPRELIAAVPAPERDASRLLVLRRDTQTFAHHAFRDLPALLRAGDLLVVNDSRVIRARLHGKRLATGGGVEFLLLERTGQDAQTDRWLVLCRPARKLKPGETVYFANRRLEAVVLHHRGEGEREVEFRTPDILAWLDELGEVPLPPYILQRRRELAQERRGSQPFDIAADADRYQTVYAREPGSVAAPTAGLHFTPALLDALAAAGIERTAVTLHVGAGTFRPVETEEIEQHRMHVEHFAVSAEAAAAINAARAAGRRVVAVGTTCVRVLESLAAQGEGIRPGRFDTDLMITPGFAFRAVDALITNFHLPRSTLLMLVSAFAGREFVLRAYEEAVRERYRFYSYGDAMLIL